MKKVTKKIALWSGPRNISTALMYSFGNRKDTSIVDLLFRIGEDDKNYYEIHQPVYEGWNDKNHIQINLDELTRYKLNRESLDEFEDTGKDRVFSPYENGCFDVDTFTTPTADCMGIPGGSAEEDECGVCEGEGPPCGDVNSDGIINILDVIIVVNVVLGIDNNSAADINGDNIINILDIIELINIILN